MNADQNSLTDWIRLRNSPDESIRSEAARRIVAEFDQQLLALIKNKLPKEIQGRVDAEDVVQSAFASLFRRSNEFPSRNAMFAYLRDVALHKADNIRKYNRRQVRDARREAHDGQLENTTYDPDFLGAGKKLVAFRAEEKRAYHRDIEIDPAQVGSDDSSSAAGTVEIMLHNWSSNVGVIVLDLIECLREFDAREGDCLQKIASLYLKEFGPGEIAAQLGLSKKTIERKWQLIQHMWGLAKAIAIKVEGRSESADGTPIVVLRSDTAGGILRRLHAEGYRLYREVAGAPAHSFTANELVYPRVAEGDTLIASPSQWLAGAMYGQR